MSHAIVELRGHEDAVQTVVLSERFRIVAAAGGASDDVAGRRYATQARRRASVVDSAASLSGSSSV